jgi:hypothetical protein
MVSRHMDPVLSPDSVRPATSEDREALGRMLSRLSARTIYERFHALYPSVPAWALAGMVGIDHEDKEALVAVVGRRSWATPCTCG